MLFHSISHKTHIARRTYYWEGGWEERTSTANQNILQNRGWSTPQIFVNSPTDDCTARTKHRLQDDSSRRKLVALISRQKREKGDDHAWCWGSGPPGATLCSDVSALRLSPRSPMSKPSSFMSWRLLGAPACLWACKVTGDRSTRPCEVENSSKGATTNTINRRILPALVWLCLYPILIVRRKTDDSCFSLSFPSWLWKIDSPQRELGSLPIYSKLREWRCMETLHTFATFLYLNPIYFKITIAIIYVWFFCDILNSGLIF